VLVIDEDLGNCPSSLGTLCHLVSGQVISINFVFGVLDTFPPQQQFCSNTKGTELPGVDLNLGINPVWVAIQNSIEEVKHIDCKY